MEVQKVPLFGSTRLGIYTMIFLSSLVHYSVRYALNMNIVCMVVPMQRQTFNNTAENTTITPNQSIDPHCHYNQGKKGEFGFEGEFHWSRSQVGYILAAYFYAYIPMQMLAGWLADKVGVRHVLGTGILIGGLLSLLTPLAARLHYGLLIALRAVMGLAVGVQLPCLHTTIGNWVPKEERGTYMGLTNAGIGGGLITSFLLSGFLCPYSWTLVFYIFGGLAILWYVVFFFIGYNHPNDHPRISETEKLYITESNEIKAGTIKRNIPWRGILTSPSVWALCVHHLASVWLYYTAITGIPLFMQDVMYFSIKDNGVISSLPAIVNMLSSGLIGVLFDLAHRNLIRSRRAARQTAEAISAIGSITCAILVGFMTCRHRIQASIVFCLIYVCLCFSRMGHGCSPSDIAPRFAGTVFGIMNLAGNIAGLLVPIAIGNLTENGSQAEWQKVFVIAAVVGCTGWLFFIIFVKADEQAWARNETKNIEISEFPEANVFLANDADSTNKHEKI